MEQVVESAVNLEGLKMAAEILKDVGFFDLAGKLIALLVIFLISRRLIEWVQKRYENITERWLQKENNIFVRLGFGKEQLQFIGDKVIAVAYWFMAAVMILPWFGIDTSSIIMVLSIMLAAIALAMQQDLSSVIGAFFIFVDKPFVIGDRVIINDKIGDVIDVGLRHTKILTLGNTVMIVPNSEISKTTIYNQYFPDKTLFCFLQIGIAYESSINTARKVILNVLKSHSEIVQKASEMKVRLDGYGASAIDLIVAFRIKDAKLERDVRSDVLEDIFEGFQKHNVEIPYPRRVLIQKGGKK